MSKGRKSKHQESKMVNFFFNLFRCCEEEFRNLNKEKCIYEKITRHSTSES